MMIELVYIMLKIKVNVLVKLFDEQRLIMKMIMIIIVIVIFIIQLNKNNR